MYGCGTDGGEPVNACGIYSSSALPLLFDVLTGDEGSEEEEDDECDESSISIPGILTVFAAAAALEFLR